MGGVGSDNTQTLIKQLVRYALACEFSRTPIRRDGIRDKGMYPVSRDPEGAVADTISLIVLGRHGREFKKVFNGAQLQLRTVFGMEMVELPAKDRNLLTADQKRKGLRHALAQ